MTNDYLTASHQPGQEEESGMARIEFRASLPEIMSAISVGSDGARLKIDVPETDIRQVMKLAEIGRGKVWEVTVEIEDE